MPCRSSYTLYSIKGLNWQWCEKSKIWCVLSTRLQFINWHNSKHLLPQLLVPSEPLIFSLHIWMFAIDSKLFVITTFIVQLELFQGQLVTLHRGEVLSHLCISGFFLLYNLVINYKSFHLGQSSILPAILLQIQAPHLDWSPSPLANK